MDRQSVKVFFAVALGIGLGMLAGHSVHPSFGWLVGAVVGGITGYIGYAPIAALQDLRVAWRHARGIPVLDFLRVARWGVYAMAAITSLVVVPVTLLVMGGYTTESMSQWLTQLPWVALVAAGLFGLHALFVGAMTGPDPIFTASAERWIGASWSEDARARKYEFAAGGYGLIVYIFFPPIIAFYHLPRGLWWCAKQVPNLARFIGAVSREWFLLVHSDARLLCGGYAFLFAGVGLLRDGSTIVWMLIGGLLGVVHHELITKRLLIPRGLIPVRERRK